MKLPIWQSGLIWLRRGRFLLPIMGLILVYAAGLDVRREVLGAQRHYIGEDMPFTLESALHFRRVKMLFDRGYLPEIDEAIQYPEGIRIREIDAISSEPVQAFIASLFPESISFAERIRWIEAGWFCLSIPLLVIFLKVWTGSWMAGWIAGLLYAVSLASVLRTTGQEISRENFAFPFIVASYICAARYLSDRATRCSWLWNVGVGLFTCLSLVAWDMSQYMVGVFALGMSIHVLGKGPRINRQVTSLLFSVTMATLLTGLLHPYHRYHGLAFSPIMLWLISIGFAAIYLMKTETVNLARRWIYPALIIVVPVMLVQLAGLFGTYGSSYGHFSELMAAKIRFMNVKPSEPSLMTYYQRIMWVPSLHSATWGLTKWLFPFTLWVSGIVVIVAFIISRKRSDPLIFHWILVFGISVLAYVFFVRFHVFVVLSVCVLAGWACGRARQAGIGWQAPVVLIMSLAIMAEGVHTMQQRHQMGRPNVYYDELKELAEWLKERVAPNPVLANMGASAYIAAYGKCPIVIHPKFEDPSIRQRLFQYGDLLFGSDEKQFRDWMDDLGVKYYVYAKGEFAREQPELQMRYFVNRMNPPDDVPARRFERDDDSFRYFTRLWGNHKYVVYEAMTREVEATAMEYALGAERLLQAGHLDEAEALAFESLAVDRMNEAALQVIRHVGSLRNQGFNYRPERVSP